MIQNAINKQGRGLEKEPTTGPQGQMSSEVWELPALKTWADLINPASTNDFLGFGVLGAQPVKGAAGLHFLPRVPLPPPHDHRSIVPSVPGCGYPL